ncbi:MAG TPA: SAM-dependent methyltransferase [Bryobacteraceae bacterium]|nr:SAM-dependent methyltransferase [Bryobacteraceae bacterium]
MAYADTASARRLVNAQELHDEVRINAGTEAAVKEHFPSFLEYQDLVMFHPKFGYYASGRVSFTSDYQTYPNVLAPYFGHMIAQQIFRMWRGMRQAGILGPNETFTISEFGAGNGSLAESILEYLSDQAKEDPDKAWSEFNSQVLYICYDRSPALSKTQRERNARFGKRFEAREADATNPTATIKPESQKGVVLSNELPDAFSVHKTILGADGTAEVGFVAPSLTQKSWDWIKKEVPAAVVQTVEKGDRSIREKIFAGKSGHVYLTRDAFAGLLEAMVPSKNYASAAQALEFNELYIPVRFVPEVAEHLRRYARFYSIELAKSEQGVVTYINLGLEKFIQGSGHILQSGFVITLDYGTNWEGMIAQDLHPHFRTYGPAHQEENRQTDLSAGDNVGTSDRDTSDPYRGPTLNDMTTDVNFSLAAAEGRLAGLTTAYFGPQAGLQTGTTVTLENLPPSGKNDVPDEVYYSWAGSFKTDGNYKLMVQQKASNGAFYTYPNQNSERLASDENSLTEGQREKAAQFEKKLSTLK